jgi:hypothetical protein
MAREVAMRLGMVSTAAGAPSVAVGRDGGWVPLLTVPGGAKPEDVVFDAAGRLYAGVEDGRIWRWPAGFPDSGAAELFADTHGRSGRYREIVGVRQHEGWLYLGSLYETAVGRVPVPT